LVLGSNPSGPTSSPLALHRQRFFRLDSDRNRASGGLGLCREIVSAHGGRVELVRSDGTWTEFAVRLPVAVAKS
jgi:signal transduction histidine kinase